VPDVAANIASAIVDERILARILEPADAAGLTDWTNGAGTGFHRSRLSHRSIEVTEFLSGLLMLAQPIEGVALEPRLGAERCVRRMRKRALAMPMQANLGQNALRGEVIDGSHAV